MLSTVDLNLLVPLQSILRHANVTRAAREQAKSQPAMSVVLRKCRVLFDDDLLVREGGRHVLTAGGTDLLTELDNALAVVAALLTPPDFDPSSCTRAFTIAASDYVLEMLAAPLARQLSERADGVTINFVPLQQMDQRMVPEFVIVPPRYATRDGEELLSDDWVVAARPGRFAGAHIGAADLADMRHVRYSIAGEPTVADAAIDSFDLGLRVPITVPDFGTALRLAAASDLVTIVPRRLAMRLAATVDFGLAELDLEIPRLTEVLNWPPSFDRDIPHIWLRGLLRDCALNAY
jgi:DNA-binding transcriptional LysR family regulator